MMPFCECKCRGVRKRKKKLLYWRQLRCAFCTGQDLEYCHHAEHASVNVLRNDNSSGRSAIYCLPTRKLLAVDRIFINGFVSLISVVTGNGNPPHFKSIFPAGKPTASYLPHPNLFCSRVPLTSSVVRASWLASYETHPLAKENKL